MFFWRRRRTIKSHAETATAPSEIVEPIGTTTSRPGADFRILQSMHPHAMTIPSSLEGVLYSKIMDDRHPGPPHASMSVSSMAVVPMTHVPLTESPLSPPLVELAPTQGPVAGPAPSYRSQTKKLKQTPCSSAGVETRAMANGTDGRGVAIRGVEVGVS